MHIIVSDQWLNDCGMSRLSGVSLKVIKHTPMWSKGESMYEVELPEGRSWVVWSIRGVKEVDDPSPIVPASEPRPEIRTDYLSVVEARKKVRRRGKKSDQTA
jgi:hypothetical protein